MYAIEGTDHHQPVGGLFAETYAEYELEVNVDGTVTFGISYVKVDDIVTMLDALERALAAQRPV